MGVVGEKEFVGDDAVGKEIETSECGTGDRVEAFARTLSYVLFSRRG